MKSQREIVCDGCGAKDATPAHLRERVARLEMATRFRPIHIETVILHTAPPERLADYFYAVEDPENGAAPAKNSPAGNEARAFSRAILGASGVATSENGAKAEDRASLLAQLQRKGIFFATCAECPVSAQGFRKADFAERIGKAALLRLKFSYKPKRIVLLSRELAPITAILRDSEFCDALRSAGGEPLDFPRGENASEWARFEEALRAALANR